MPFTQLMVMLFVLFLSSSPDSQKVSVEPSVRLPIMAGRLDVLMSTTLVRSFRQVTRHRSCNHTQIHQNHFTACHYHRGTAKSKMLIVGSIPVWITKLLFSCLAYRFIAWLHTDVKALLTVSIIWLGQDIVDVMENIALMEELVVRLLELETPAPKRRGH